MTTELWATLIVASNGNAEITHLFYIGKKE